MKNLHAAQVILLAVFSGSGLAQQAAAPTGNSTSAPVSAPVSVDSPAQLRIDAAKRQIQTNPKKVQAYNDLAAADLRRARETADPRYCGEAEAARAQGSSLDAKDFQLLKTQVAVLLCRHDYAGAKDKAAILHKRWPDDVQVYGYLAEADIALGDYSGAETNTQWMLNMLPNNVPGLLIGANLRVLFGDPDGALEFLNQAYSETSPTEVEELAWIANQMASVEIDMGKIEAASSSLERAGQLFPGYPYTLENLARVRLAQNRAKDAVALLTQATQLDSDPHALYALAAAQSVAGQSAEARVAFTEFERLASLPSSRSENATRDLILLHAGTAAGAANALMLAQHEVHARQDVWTLDAYAWALYANGRFGEAGDAMKKALAVGIRNAQIFDHAGHIAQELHHDADAANDFQSALQANPFSEAATDARAALNLPAATRPQQTASAAPQEDTSTSVEVSSASASPAPAAPAVPAPSDSSQPTTWGGFVPVSSDLLTPRPTETARSIRTAQAMVAHNQKDAEGYAALGAAYFQQARETGDVGDYQLAEEALNKSLDLDSGDFAADSALGTMAAVCMGEHRFDDALANAHKALSLGSGDVTPFAIVGDAYADKGEYAKAGDAYARLTPAEMTLSPRAAYVRDSRISYLHFIQGDTGEAIRTMNIAVAEGTEAQIPSENLAWLYYELGEFETQSGDAAAADTAYLAALAIHPGDYRALAGLARLRANHGRYNEAIKLYQSAIAVVPMPVFVAELGDLYAKAGNSAEAARQYQLVEYIGRLGRINQVLHNRDLALFYADHDMKLPEALQLAQKEFEVRHDIYTWDALAWALYKNGRFAEAAKASDSALKFGTRDALLLYHAGVIADRLGQREKAKAELQHALAINPHFHLLYADAAQRALAQLDAPSAASESAVNNAR
jgi:tetratricopeptide (TPR) repeat protein